MLVKSTTHQRNLDLHELTNGLKERVLSPKGKSSKTAIYNIFFLLHSFSKLLVLVSSSLASLQACLAAFSKPDGLLPLKRSK